MSYEIRDLTHNDLPYFEQHMRDADRKECLAASGSTPTEALSKAVGDDYAKVALVKGKLLMAFGVSPVSQYVGGVWALCTDTVDTDPTAAFLLARHSRKWVEDMQSIYPILWNFCDARNTLHHRFLTFQGFKFINKQNIGINGEAFYEIVRIQEDV